MNDRALGAAALFVLLVGPAVLSAEDVSILGFAALGAWLWTVGFRIPVRLPFLLAPLLLILLVGVAGSAGHPAWAVLRDVWYLGKSIVLFAFGFLVAWRVRFRTVLRVVLLAALVTAAIHMVRFLFFADLAGAGLAEIRGEAGTGSFLAVAAIAVLAGARRHGLLLLPRWGRWMVLGVTIASVVVSLSRTWLVALAIMWFAVEGGLNLLRPGTYSERGVRKVVTVSVAIVLICVVVLYVGGKTVAGSEFLWKLGRSIEEIAASDYHSQREITLNWRGYESHRALMEYRRSSPLEHLAGKGYGASIDMAIRTVLGGESMRFLPTIHNGWVYLLVKTGIVGVVLYAWFFLRLMLDGYRASRSSFAEITMAGDLVVGAGAVLLVTTLTISGLMNKSSLNAAVILAAVSAAAALRMTLDREAAP